MSDQNDADSSTDTRPAQHGGGEASPPIAGDPSSFPDDAELSRTLIAATRTAALSTINAKGYPYGSVVSHADDGTGAPVVLVSEMAEHTVNLHGDDRVSMLLVADDAGADPLSVARLTLVGRMQKLDSPGELRDRYLAAHPYASYYADFTDFGFWRMTVEECRYVGGFGHMSWVTGTSLADAVVDPLWEVATGVVDHMNEDHQEANLVYVRALAGLVDATEATMTAIDRLGVTLSAKTPGGPRMARVPFAEPLTSADQARPAVIELLQQGRELEA